MAGEPIWQKHSVCIWTNRSDFDPIRALLRQKYGLVEARDSKLTPDLLIHWPKGRKLVYADPETGQGIYRVDFREKTLNDPYWPNDLISFGYWSLDKLPPHFREDDPMKAALADAFNILKPEHVTLGYEIAEPVDLSSLLEMA